MISVQILTKFLNTLQATEGKPKSILLAIVGALQDWKIAHDYSLKLLDNRLEKIELNPPSQNMPYLQ